MYIDNKSLEISSIYWVKLWQLFKISFFINSLKILKTIFWSCFTSSNYFFILPSFPINSSCSFYFYIYRDKISCPFFLIWVAFHWRLFKLPVPTLLTKPESSLWHLNIPNSPLINVEIKSNLFLNARI